MFLESNPKPLQEFFELYSPSIAKQRNTLLSNWVIRTRQKHNKKSSPLEPVKQEKRQWETQRELGNHNRPTLKQWLQQQTRKAPFQLRSWVVAVVVETLSLSRIGTKHMWALSNSTSYFFGDLLSLKTEDYEKGIGVKWVLGIQLRLECMCNGLVWDPSLGVEPPLPFPGQGSMFGGFSFCSLYIVVVVVQARETVICVVEIPLGAHMNLLTCGSQLHCVCHYIWLDSIFYFIFFHFSFFDPFSITW